MERTLCRALVVLVMSAWTLATTLGAGEAFRASYETGFDADSAGGRLQATVTGAAARVGDRYGTSLVLGPQAGVCSYALAGNLSLDQGSVIAWVQPTGWRSDAAAPLTLLRAATDARRMALWWEPRSKTLLFAWEAGGKVLAVAKPAYDWSETSWHHLVATWTAGAASLYVDGQAAQTVPGTPPSLPACETDRVTLGGDFGPAATLAVRARTILAEPLSAESVQDHYRVAVSGQVEQERPALTVGPCAKPPVIDGKLTPGEWDLAAGTTGFVEIGTGTLSSVGTRGVFEP